MTPAYNHICMLCRINQLTRFYGASGARRHGARQTASKTEPRSITSPPIRRKFSVALRCGWSQKARRGTESALDGINGNSPRRDAERRKVVRGYSGSARAYTQMRGQASKHEANELMEEEVDALDNAKDRAQYTESVVRAIRQRFGERVPADMDISEEVKRVYERLYGVALVVESEEDLEQQLQERDTLWTEAEDGELVEVELGAEEIDGREEITLSHDERLGRDIDAVLHGNSSRDGEASTEQQAQEDREGDEEADMDEFDPFAHGELLRAHPLTIGGRFATFPSSLILPKDTFIDPITTILSEVANKHLDQTAERVFGGPGLPYAHATPRSSRSMPQKPISLSAGQTKMTDIEANVFLAALMPANYAVATSILTEVRKRLGTSWLQGLLSKKGGPRILDAGSGGAAVLAWRDILNAEWRRMLDDDAKQTSLPGLTGGDTPVGKATVLTGSDSLRHKASQLLENTTFLPRLPDYIHASPTADPSPRKTYDVIIAPHALWYIQEPHLREQQIQNLWSLLDPNGGVLILWEKGVPRGFEVVADARQHLLRDLFEAPYTSSTAPPAVSALENEPRGSSIIDPPMISLRHPAHIIAPCTNHTKCPMYTIPGITQGRKHYCHFEQRMTRPAFYQRLLGARERNEENIAFAYLAVRKGRHDKAAADAQVKPTHQDEAATVEAAKGYDVSDAISTFSPSPSESPATRVTVPTSNPIYSGLPRLLLPPLKRKGHVILDVCTPSGTLERWTVPRSFGKQAFRDAKKSQWGDLWALGAKTRVKRDAGKSRTDENEDEDDGDDEEGQRAGRVIDVKGRVREKGMEREGKARREERGRGKARKRRREETKRIMLRANDEVI